MCGGSSTRWPAWFSVSCLAGALALCPAPLTAQSTTGAPPRPDTKPKSVLVSLDDLLTLRAKIANLQENSLRLAEQLQASETIQQELSESLTRSSSALESLTQASARLAAENEAAIQGARRERDTAYLFAWGGGGAAALVLVLHFTGVLK